MAWLEMSRNSTHGDLTGKSDWSFKKCLWSPIRKRDGGRNAYWETMSMIEKGDVIIHMRWINGDPFLVGTSIAASDCFIETNERPPDPEEWAYATSFYRVLLEDFEDFPVQLSLRKIFDNSDLRFRKYLIVGQRAQKSQYFLQFVQIPMPLQPLNCSQTKGHI
jgi:putative restriction endonuclease